MSLEGRCIKKKVSSYLMFHSFFVHESLVLEGTDEKNV